MDNGGGAPPDRAPGPGGPAEGGDGLTRRFVFGFDFVDASSLEPVVGSILGHRAHRHGIDRPLRAVLTPNVDILVGLDANASSRAASVYRRAQYLLPDGMPVVVASRLLRRPLRARLPGSGLFELLWPRLAASGRPVVVVCANEVIAETLVRDHPGARFLVPPFVDVSNDEQMNLLAKTVAEAAVEVEAEFLLVGLGHPKDALIIDEVNELWTDTELSAPLGLGLGGSFAMYIGQRRRAPEWMQRVGLEWFHRFLQEPRRLFRRYFIDDAAFLGLVWREWRRR